MKKTHVGIVFGGKSSEHQISLLSAKNIIEAIDPKIFDLSLIGVDSKGVWRLYDQQHYLAYADDPNKISLVQSEKILAFMPTENQVTIIDTQTQEPIRTPDVIFPIIHGAHGEDGTLQGFFEILNIPYVGSKVLSSAICMDKDIAKKLLRDAGIKVAPFVTLTNAKETVKFTELEKSLGACLFIKPANEGSSVGVSKATDQQSLDAAIKLAFSFDHKVIIETAINGKEVECAVLGSTLAPKASVCGEVVSQADFYSYEAKYIDNRSSTIIPAHIDEHIQEKIGQAAIQAYQTLGCTGLARVDFFLTTDNELILNEVNTLPGFTNISMYPKLWEKSGINYSDLITYLINQAITN
ncbi:D-alanine--D-alanine ligase [Neisseria sp. Ec49-e6-T10]|uniref:D-alanine--D-alanine ligase n=1 Tax=Neisseria sp. Ec49-e6-T10 TaxID=3140744 RepID=UPI003EB8C24D